MKRLLFLLFIGLTACNSTEKKQDRLPYKSVDVEILLEDSLNIRAIEIMGQDLAFAGANGVYGIYNSAENGVRLNRQQHDSIYPEFRAVASTANDFFMLSVANPALLYKTGEDGQMELVYSETHENFLRLYDLLE
ncbi:hypothetical protein [Salinimicrobium flavum]|uniref:Lipoprotein n=1 Tax=Salinimicrobium flavum TaxID=1737065 RepID=A0ABW5J001_9FLAO